MYKFVWNKQEAPGDKMLLGSSDTRRLGTGGQVPQVGRAERGPQNAQTVGQLCPWPALG